MDEKSGNFKKVVRKEIEEFMLLNKDQVMQFLPHRDPFLFVDSIDSIEFPEQGKFKDNRPTVKDLIGGKVVANLRIDDSIKVLEGHFPGRPILPGVVQVEAMAQTAAFMMFPIFEDPFNTELEVALLGVDDSKFRRPVIPPMDLKIEATLVKARGPMTVYECVIYNNDTLVSQATVLATMKVKEVK